MANAKQDSTASQAPEPKRKNRKKLAIAGGIIGVIVVAAIGMWVWHESPTFCNNPICHDSMDPYVASYYAQDKEPGVDKWGNEVENAHAMLAVSHAAKDMACLDCHKPDLRQQVGEVIETVTGNYQLPLEEVDTLALIENAYKTSPSGLGDEFCMNDACHSDLSRDALKEMTSVLPFNPHAWNHEQNKCSDCHKSHRASTVMCTQCHEEAYKIMPKGWVDYDTAKAYEEAARA